MPGYISARFEQDALPTSNQVRAIVRNVDQGDSPPLPTLTYFPTDPDTLRAFLVAEYVSDSLGERYVRVAALADLELLSVRTLNTFEDLTADFIAAGVSTGDILEVVQADSELWVSEEYPSSTFQFSVTEVLSATQITVAGAFPAFQTTLGWTITAQSLSGSNGTTRRDGSPTGGTLFRESRLAQYVANAVASAEYVTAVKAGMASLVSEVTGEGLTTENYTASPQ